MNQVGPSVAFRLGKKQLRLDVMQIAHHYFENGISYFTRRINRCISMGTASLFLPHPSPKLTSLHPQHAQMAKSRLSWATTRTSTHFYSTDQTRTQASRFLRWKACQDAAFIDPADGKEKIWSETNVSEDFDMALRLMMKGYIIR
jgi:hypothetical protein